MSGKGRSRADQRLERHARFRRALIAIAREGLSGGLDEGTFQHFLEQAVAAVPGAQAGSIVRRRNDGRFGFVAALGFPLAELQQVTLAEHELLLSERDPLSTAVPVRRYRRFNRTMLDAARRAVFETAGRSNEIAVALTAPVVVDGALQAVLYLDNFEDEHAFDGEALELAEILAALMGTVLQRLLLQADTERRARFQQLLAAAERLLLAYDFDDFLPRLSDLLLAEPQLRLDQIGLYRLLPDGRLEPQLFGVEPALGTRIEAALREMGLLHLDGPGLMAAVARGLKPHYAPDVTVEPRWVNLPLWSAEALPPPRCSFVYPLSQGGQLWGVIDFMSTVPAAFGPAERELFSQLAASIELALSRQADRLRLQQQLARFRAVVEANAAIREAETVEEVYAAATQAICHYTGARTASVLLYDRAADRLQVAASQGENAEALKGLVLPRGQGVSWQVIEARRTCHLHDIGSHPAAYFPSGAVRYQNTDYIGTPLLDESGEVMGVVTASIVGNGFVPENVAFIEAIAQACASALTRLELLERSRREAFAYRELADFGAQIEEINDVEVLLALGIKHLRQQLKLPFVHLYERSGEAFRLVRHWGEVPETLLAMNRSALASPDQGAIGQAVHWGKLIYVADYQRWPEAIPAYREQGLCSLVAIPVRRQGKVESVVVFYSLSPVTLKEEQLTVARNFVKRLEHALERADTLREVEATREATFRSLGLMLEYRDFETKGHTDRVVALSLRFGKALRLEVRLLEALRWGAYLHDIGKVAIADKILLKPSKLTPEEFEAVKRHPLYGVEICRDIPFLPTETRQIVRSHHERWDGAGYPDGLVGNEIPLLARLFSLVDVYDALISVRPYKPAWSKAEACLELRRQAGHQFDPELTRRFLRLIETGR